VTDELLTRQPPNDAESEQAVLGGMMMSRDAVADVLEELRGPDDFYRPAHQTIYEAILSLYARGEPTDAVALRAELTRTGAAQRVGDAPYLHTLLAATPSVASAGYYAHIVADLAVQRRIVQAGVRVTQIGYGTGDVDDAVVQVEAEIDNATRRHGGSNDPMPFEQLLQGSMDEIDAISSRGGRLTGVPTGFLELDRITNGLHAGQMIVVAARPAIGKSTLGLDLIRACSIKDRATSVIFSLEMSKSEIMMRLLSAEARVPLHHLRNGYMSDDDWTNLARRMGEVADAPIYIDDSANLTMMEIRSKARRLRHQRDVRLVVVDYMQLMTSGKRVESRQQEVSEFSRQLKLLAKELEVPVVAISQLNRGPEQRTDKRPLLSDLRESGSIEQDADIVVLLHREDAYDAESPRAGEADLILAKHRNGPTATVTVAFQGHYSRFVDMAG
jgi:replicative DNA helicase